MTGYVRVHLVARILEVGLGFCRVEQGKSAKPNCLPLAVPAATHANTPV